MDSNIGVTVAGKLLDKISSAAAWCVTHDTPQKISIEVMVEEIKKSNLSILEKAAYISNANKILKEYINQHDVVKEGMKYLSDKAEPEKVDDDWIALFMDKARLVSDKEFQKIWGKILAEECNYPGQLSKQLLHIVSMMDRQDAQAFTNICRFSLVIDCDDEDTRKYKYPLFLNSRLDDYYFQYGINLDNLRSLESYGLIERIQDHNLNTCYVLDTEHDVKGVSYYGHRYDFHADEKEVFQGDLILKKPGRELCKVIEVEAVNDFWDKIALPYLEAKIPI